MLQKRGGLRFYAFPPFSLILKSLKKIEDEEAEGVLIIPNWSTQPWFPKLTQLLVDHPYILPLRKNVIQNLVNPDHVHLLWSKLHLMACKLSGRRSKNREVQMGQQTASSNPGDMVRPNNTK